MGKIVCVSRFLWWGGVCVCVGGVINFLLPIGGISGETRREGGRKNFGHSNENVPDPPPPPVNK